MRKHLGALLALLAFGALVATIAGSSAVATPNMTIGSVTCPLPQYNPTHFSLEIGQSITCTISASLVGSPSTVDVYVRSTPLGNTTVTGTVVDSTITFSFTAPQNGCETTNIGYDNGAGKAVNAHAGFAYVDSNGAVVNDCSSPLPAADLAVTSTATPSFKKSFIWGIQKTVDKTKVSDPSGSAAFGYTVTVAHDAGTAGGWKTTGTVTVDNPNTVDVSGVTVTDAIDNGGTCSVSGGTNVTVPAESSVDLAYTCTYTSAPSPAAGTNTATATWPSFGSPNTSATGTAAVDFGSTSPTLADNCATVTDTLAGPLGTVCTADPSPKLFTYSHTVTGSAGTCVTQDNTATFITNTTATSASSSTSVQMCTPVDLTVTKTAAASSKRTYLWSIAKKVDKTTFDSGGTAGYTVTVNQTGISDNLWTVSGSITVTNPNDFESVTLAGVTDVISNGGLCAITSGDPTETLLAGGSVVLGYLCTYTAAPSQPAFTNTATASWLQGAAQTAHGSASGVATGSFGPPTPTDQTVTISDSFAGTLGTVTAVDAKPFTSKDFTYQRTLTPPASGCVTVNNTATIVETGQTASQAVQSCNTTPAPNPPVTTSETTTTTAPASNPAISIVKNPKSQTIKAGGTASFTITVTNTGNVALTGVTVADALSPNCNQSSSTIPALASLAPGASVTYNCSLANVAATFTNVAIATGTSPAGSTVNASDSSPVTVRAPAPLTPPTISHPAISHPAISHPAISHPAISLVKDPASQTIATGGTATFTITVENVGNVKLSAVTVSDALSPGCDRAVGALAVGESKTYTCTQANVDKGFLNIATATGKPPTGAPVKASSRAQVKVAPFVPPPSPRIAVVKSPKSQTLTTKVTKRTSAAGVTKTTVVYSSAHFTIKVTNTGNVALHDVQVADPASPGCVRSIGSLAPGASHAYTCSRATVSMGFTNVATATGISPSGTRVSAVDHAGVVVKAKTTSTRAAAKFTG